MLGSLVALFFLKLSHFFSFSCPSFFHEVIICIDNDKDMEIEKIKRTVMGVASDKEKEEVEAWGAGDEERRRILDDALWFYRSEGPDGKEIDRRVAGMRRSGTVHRRKRRSVYLRRIAVAACAAAVAGAFFFADLLRKEDRQPDTLAVTERPVAVELVLPDGSRHTLPEEKTVEEIVSALEAPKNTGQHSQLPEQDSAMAPEPAYYEIIVPRGKEYELTLADGSAVTLNAGSRIKYPVDFAADGRKVCVEGEAYFDVARDEVHPFVVEFAAGEVRVLGTQFNVKAYDGEHTCATLVTGKVEVISDKETALLRPGQFCEIRPGGLSVGEADLMAVLAWKNGEFIFKDAPWQQVIDELARRYDAELIYEERELGDLKLHIYMKRPASLEAVLAEIERITDISYDVEGKKVIIKKQ